MKKQQKQTGNELTIAKKKVNSEAKENGSRVVEMVNEDTHRVNEKKQRKHSRSFYMAVNPKGGAVVTKKSLPIFWRKSLAREAAEKINGKAVLVTMSW